MTAERPQQEILRAATALFKTGDVIELRVPGSRNGRGPTLAGYYDDFAKLAEDAASVSGQPGVAGVYFTINPVLRALLARSKNHLSNIPNMTSDKDVLARTHFLVDVDPARPSGISATDEEKALAKAVAQQVRNHLLDRGWPEPFFADSANGYHVIFTIDLPNDDSSRDLIKTCLAALARRFDTAGVKIDQTVFNAARIGKVYGTLAAKGDSTTDRPHRVARLLDAPEQEIVYRMQLEELAGEAPQQTAKAPNGAALRTAPELEARAKKLEEFLALAGIEHGGRLAYGEGFKWVLDNCWFDSTHIATSIIVTLAASGALGYHCSHASCRDNRWQKFRAEVERKLGRKFFFAGDGQDFNAQGAAQSEVHSTPAEETGSEWPVPQPLGSELPSVEPFSEELLPISFQPLARDTAELMQVPQDFPAVALMLCLAGAVNRRAVIQPKAKDSSWKVVPNAWGGIVARPGCMKSPLIERATAALKQIQDEWHREYEEAMSEYESAKEEAELLKQASREKYKSQWKKHGTASLQRPDDPVAPVRRRIIVNDATPEALHEKMGENPAGIFVIRDELTGWFANLEKKGRENERAFCLEAWNGDSGFTLDRIERGTIHVPHCAMSMLGGIQPARLRSYLVDALEGGPSDDGLMQRFQLLVWPDYDRPYENVDRPPDSAALALVEKIFRNLIELDPERPAFFRFAPDAQQLFDEWRSELENEKLRGDEHPALISHLSKYRSLTPTLAVLFELADRAGFEGFDGSSLAESTNFVTLEHAQKAAAWCDYLESHARRVYSCIASPQLRVAQELKKKIKERKVGGSDGVFSCRDVYFKGWSGLDTPEAVKLAGEVLQDAGWIRSIGAPGPQGGRPSDRYEINPRIWSNKPGDMEISASAPKPPRRNRWLEWKPKGRIIAGAPQSEPSKPSKPPDPPHASTPMGGFEGFEGAISGPSPIIRTPDPPSDPREAPEEDDDGDAEGWEEL